MLWLRLYTQDCSTGKSVRRLVRYTFSKHDLTHWQIWSICSKYKSRFSNYLSFFCRLVDTINNSIGQDPESKSLIGVLDIYGFESFKNNRCVTSTAFVV